MDSEKKSGCRHREAVKDAADKSQFLEPCLREGKVNRRRDRCRQACVAAREAPDEAMVIDQRMPKIGPGPMKQRPQADIDRAGDSNRNWDRNRYPFVASEHEERA